MNREELQDLWQEAVKVAPNSCRPACPGGFVIDALARRSDEAQAALAAARARFNRLQWAGAVFLTYVKMRHPPIVHQQAMDDFENALAATPTPPQAYGETGAENQQAGE